MAWPVVDEEYRKQIDKARRLLRGLISGRNCAPIILRLAWHDAGTYDVRTKTGGPNGSIRSEEEYSHGSNAGLKKAIDWCEEVKAKTPKITYADLYQHQRRFLSLNGAAAVDARRPVRIKRIQDYPLEPCYVKSLEQILGFDTACL